MSMRWSILRIALVFTAALPAVSGCAVDDVRNLQDSSPAITLAMSVEDADDAPKTKMSTTVTQSDGVFRGIDQIFIVPFNTDGSPVSLDDYRLGNSNVVLLEPRIGSTDLVYNNNSHLFEASLIPKSMNHVLAYGNASNDGDISTKYGMHFNGRLTPEGLANPTRASDIFFNLVPVLEGSQSGELSEITTKADNILAALNNIVAAILQSKNEHILSILDIIKRENQILACSYPVFNRIRSEIQTALLNVSGEDPATIADKIRVNTAINSFSTVLGEAGDNFPVSYGIPEGALGFWWNGAEFIRLINGVNIALVNPADYCYPPSLWYYANSPIRTSDDESVRYKYVPDNQWSEILDFYQDGAAVIASTRSVAIEDAFQYGVGMLEISFKEPGSEAALAATGCPLTGIIIGDQKDVDYNFMPATTRSNPSRYIYDNIVGDLKIGDTGTSVQTLTLQTVDNYTVHFALEFQNRTGKTLYCQQGEILPWCKFYLAGKLDPNSGATQPQNETLLTVFSKDRKTTVSVKIESLRNAYNTVPDLHDPQLEIGIVAEMNWGHITPKSHKINL